MRANINCADNIRYSLSDSDGKMRFVEFEVFGVLKDNRIAETLVRYFKGRYLKDVSVDDIPRDCSIEDRNCIASIIRDISNLKRQLCAN